ncbi:MAG: GAF domain-containing protein [Gemmatimonadaceae bacterium]|nr:GAF domain-containing protein [Gemmatimonadaceae bacterium]
MSLTKPSLQAAQHALDTAELLRATRIINATLEEPHRVAAAVIELLGATVACEGGCIAMRAGGSFAIVESAPSLTSLTGQSFLSTEVFAPRALPERHAVVHDGVASVLADPAFLEPLGVRQFAAAPLIAGGAVVGALLAVNPRDGAFSDVDTTNLGCLADLAALAIRNAWLLAHDQQLANEARSLADIVQQLNQSLEFERVVRLVAETSARLLGGQGSALTLLDDDDVVVVGAAGLGASMIGYRTPARPTLVRRVALGRRVVRTNDLQQLSGDHALAATLGPEPVNAILAPLLVADRPIGVLLVAANLTREFNERDEELLAALASHAAVAIENARLYRAAAHTARHAETLSSAARSLSYAVDATSFFDELSRVARELLDASGLTLYSVDQARRTASVRYVAGIGADTLSRVASRIVTAPEFAAPLLAGEEGFFEDIRDDPLSAVWTLTAGTRIPDEIMSFARLPLIVEGRVRGALALRWRTHHAFSEDERLLLRDFATQVALAFRNADQFDAERRSREVAEAAAAIARAVLGAAAPDRTALDALTAIDRAVPSEGKAIAFVDASGAALHYLAASGVLQPMAGVSIGIAESAARLSSPLVQQDATAHALAAIGEGHLVPPGATLVPLVARDQLLGVLWSMPSAPPIPGHRTDAETLGDLAASLALAADVLLLNEEEQKRRAREHMLATALATMDQAVLIIGLDRQVMYANAAAIAEYMYAFDGAPAVLFDRLVDSANVARRVGPDGTSGAAGVWAAEHIHRRRDGSTFPASVLLSYIRDVNDVPVAQVVTVRNLTAERRIEEQLRQSEKLAALGELVAGVAHELNNPLAGISAFAQLLMDDPLDAEQHESVRLIKREADRAVGVVRDLLLFSRKTGPSQELVDFNEMVERTLRLRGYGLRSAGIEVKVDLDPAAPVVAGDSQRLQQVLLNLVINAEYALLRADVKRLIVRSESTVDVVSLFVEDSGVGMDEETKQRIFEPFFTTKPAGEGTGLGLSVSYGIVRAHGGYFHVESVPGQGTRFQLTFPRARDHSTLATA